MNGRKKPRACLVPIVGKVFNIEKSVIYDGPKISCVYAIFFIGGYFYIGSTVDLAKRLVSHHGDGKVCCGKLINWNNFFGFKILYLGKAGEIRIIEKALIRMNGKNEFSCNKIGTLTCDIDAELHKNGLID